VAEAVLGPPATAQRPGRPWLLREMTSPRSPSRRRSAVTGQTQRRMGTGL